MIDDNGESCALMKAKHPLSRLPDGNTSLRLPITCDYRRNALSRSLNRQTMALPDPGIGGMSNRAVQGISIARRNVIAWVAALPTAALARPAERKQRIRCGMENRRESLAIRGDLRFSEIDGLTTDQPSVRGLLSSGAKTTGGRYGRSRSYCIWPNHGPRLFARFLRCELEAYLDDPRSHWKPIANLRTGGRRSRDRYKQAALAVLRSRYSDDEIHVGMPAAAALKQRRWRLIIDGIVETPMLRACVDAAELARSAQERSSSYYRPIRFTPADKVGKSDKLLLAFDALALSRVTGIVPPTGRIVHGHRYARTTIPLAQPIREVRSALAKIAALRARTAPPPPVLNKHCTECEFRSRCRADAVERDDLSLLTGLNGRALKTWNNKGISTVSQLSYTFRPHRRSKRQPSRPAKHDPALKALAIRKRSSPCDRNTAMVEH